MSPEDRENRAIVEDAYGDSLWLFCTDTNVGKAVFLEVAGYGELAFNKREQIDQITKHLQLLREHLPE